MPMADLLVAERVDRLENLMTEVWQAFAETDRRLDERFTETDRRLKEQFAETDRRLDERFAETDRRLDERLAENNRWLNERLEENNRWLNERLEENNRWLNERLEENDRRLDERLAENNRWLNERLEENNRWLNERLEENDRRLDERFAETDRRLNECFERTEHEIALLSQEIHASTKKWGELSNKMGTLAEDFVAPSIPRILRTVKGCPEDQVDWVAVRFRRRHAEDRGRSQEFDVVAACGEYVLINETRSSLNAKDIDDFVELMSQVRHFFPEYADRRFIGAIASLYVDESVVRYGQKRGLLVLGLGEDLMEVLNEPGFEPLEF